jgi:hypothetical protein
LARRALRRAIHFASYNFVLNRRSTRTVRADGFRLTVRPPSSIRVISSPASISRAS